MRIGLESQRIDFPYLFQHVQDVLTVVLREYGLGEGVTTASIPGVATGVDDLDLDTLVAFGTDHSLQVDLCVGSRLVEALEMASNVLANLSERSLGVELHDLVARLIAILLGGAEFDTDEDHLEALTSSGAGRHGLSECVW